jgi:hypothetical protein
MTAEKAHRRGSALLQVTAETNHLDNTITLHGRKIKLNLKVLLSITFLLFIKQLAEKKMIKQSSIEYR